MNIKFFILSTFLTFFFKILFSQNKVFFDNIYQQNIKTAQIKPINTNFSYPLIELNSQEKLILCFDDLNAENQVFDYSYSFIHCNRDWTKSELFFDEYCTGFENNPIIDYKNSFNTLEDYVHYSVEFPNNDIEFTKSGNYIVYVFKDGNIEDTVLTKRFVVYENEIVIEGYIKVSSISSMRTTSQELFFNIKGIDFSFQNPTQYINVSILQNNRPDKAKTSIKPRFINGNELIFDDYLQNNFFAGNEFRFFESDNIRFASQMVDSIRIIDDNYEFFLIPQTEKKRYYFYNDLNGKYIVHNSLANDSDCEADYVPVHFYFEREYPYPENNLYIFGELTNWSYDDDFKMEYNNEKKMYEKTVLLKQGFYNYCYKLQKHSDIAQIDGNYFDTKNDYVIYVFYYDDFLNYDRVLGVKILSN